MDDKKIEIAAVWEDITVLVPWDQNPRNNKDAIQSVANSIKRFGFGAPIVARKVDKMVIAGHTRLEAAKLLGLSQVPVRYLDLDPADAKMLALADNRIGEIAQWDQDILSNILQEMHDNNLDLDVLGFDDDELSDLLSSTVDQDTTGSIDDVDDLDDDYEPISKMGEVYDLGGHTLVCGDCTDDQNWPTKPFRVVCDPPYGLGDTSSDKNNYATYDDTRDNLISIISKIERIFDRAESVVVTCGNGNQYIWPRPDWCMAWFTPAGVGRGPWGFCCWQPILCYGKDPKLQNRKGCYPDAIVHTESAEYMGHPCSKPINFWEWLIGRSTIEGDLVFDLFGGSGTTLIACAMSGRVAYMTEIDPRYCDIIRRRWAKYAKQHHLDIGDGIDE